MDPLSADLLQAKTRIDNENLEPIIQRLMHEKCWSRAEAEEACAQYRRFLFLNKKYGDQYELPPSLEIDEAWHAHILHTEAYASFCEKVFGKFFHHRPGTNDLFRSNVMGNSSAISFAQLFEENTQRLHYQEYGDYLYEVRASSFIGVIKRFFSRCLRSVFTREAKQFN